MNKLQFSILASILAGGFAALFYQQMPDRPSERQRVMNEHYRQSCIISGDNCDDYNPEIPK